MSTQPPTTRSRAASARPYDADGDGAGADMEPIVAAVVARLQQAGLLTPAPVEGAAAAAKSAVAETSEVPAPLMAVKGEAGVGGQFGPTLAQQQLWLEELRSQLDKSPHFGVREREEARGLLIIGESAGPPPEHQSWYWGRVRLYLIIAHQGWAAAVRDSRTTGMERLGIHLSPAAAQPPDAPRRAAAPPAGWRGRPSRPSGLRPPPGGASMAPAQRRQN